MRINLRLTSLLLWTIAASAQAPVTYSLTGTVVDHRSQTPIPSVLVAIEPVSAAQNIRVKASTFITDEAGHFLFSSLASGKYAITAQRRGGRAQQFKAHGQFSTAIAVGPQLDSEHIVFPLIADARLSGTVTDDDGEPVSEATAFLLRKQAINGKSTINLHGQQQTSASGAFHFGHLEPGTYYLAVSARPWYAAQGSTWASRSGDGGTPVITERVPPPDILQTAYAVTYSGNTIDPAAAQPIVLTEGNVITSQVNLHAVPALHIIFSGTGSSGDNPSNPKYRLPTEIAAVGPGGIRIPVQVVFEQPPAAEGAPLPENEIVGIAPGTYRLNLQSEVAPGQFVSSEEKLVLSGNASISPAKDDHVIVRGQIVSNTSLSAQNTFLQLQGNELQEAIPIEENGRFFFPSAVPPGNYKLILTNAPGLKVQGIDSGKGAITGNTLTVPTGTTGAAELKVIVGPASTSAVAGIVVRDGKPIVAAMVLLLSPDTLKEGFVGRDQSDSDGTFSIPNVPAGRYTLLAIDGADSDELADLEYRTLAAIKPYLANAQPVTVPLASKSPLTVQVALFRPMSATR